MEKQCQPPKIDEVLGRTEEPVPDGVYDAVIDEAWMWQDPGGDEMFIMVLTVLGGPYAGREFVYHAILGIHDYYMIQTVSAILRRELKNGDRVHLDELLFRRARLHVGHNNGERVISMEPSKRRDRVKGHRYRFTDRNRIIRWLGYIPSYDTEWGW